MPLILLPDASGAWPTLEQDVEDGKLLASDDLVVTLARLPQATKGDKSLVALRIDLPGSFAVMAQLTMDEFLRGVANLALIDAQEEAKRKPKLILPPLKPTIIKPS